MILYSILEGCHVGVGWDDIRLFEKRGSVHADFDRAASSFHFAKRISGGNRQLVQLSA